MNKKQIDFGKNVRNCEKGFLLLSLVIWIPLFVTLLWVTFTSVQKSQAKIASQSQLDICAVQRIHKRRLLFRAIVNTNDVIRFTNIAVASLRGISLLGGPLGKLASTMGEQALIRWNQITGKQQNLMLKLLAAEEKNFVCAPTKYAKALAFCKLHPSLANLVFRSTPSMPDLVAPLLARQNLFGQAICRKNLLVTEIQLFGDATLMQEKFREVYAK